MRGDDTERIKRNPWPWYLVNLIPIISVFDPFHSHHYLSSFTFLTNHIFYYASFVASETLHWFLSGSCRVLQADLIGSLHPSISLSLTSSSTGTGACLTPPPPVSAARLSGRSCYLTVHPVQEDSLHLRFVSHTGACVFRRWCGCTLMPCNSIVSVSIWSPSSQDRWTLPEPPGLHTCCMCLSQGQYTAGKSGMVWMI